jgi:acetyl esterase/lipase
MDRIEDSLSYYAALKKAEVPVQMHLYAQGGHAFGLRCTKFTVTEWPQLVEAWLKSSGWFRSKCSASARAGELCYEVGRVISETLTP